MSRGLTVQMLLDKLPEWQEKGYISANVWDNIMGVVAPNLLLFKETPSGGKGMRKYAILCNSVVIIWTLDKTSLGAYFVPAIQRQKRSNIS